MPKRLKTGRKFYPKPWDRKTKPWDGQTKPWDAYPQAGDNITHAALTDSLEQGGLLIRIVYRFLFPGIYSRTELVCEKYGVTYFSSSGESNLPGGGE